MSLLRALGGPWLLGWRAAGHARQFGLPWRACLFQLFQMGNRSAPLVVAGMAFFGSVMVIIANSQARRFTGNLVVLGPAYFELMVREFGPLAAAILTAARTGAMSAAELSSMSVNEQLEALELSAGDVLAELVAPRVVAGLIALPLLCTLGTLAASTSAALTAAYAFGVDGGAFIDPRFVDAVDLSSGLLKAATCGVFIPLAGCYQGLLARGGASAVGRATTQGVVAACMGCLAIDLFYTLLAQLL